MTQYSTILDNSLSLTLKKILVRFRYICTYVDTYDNICMINSIHHFHFFYLQWILSHLSCIFPASIRYRNFEIETKVEEENNGWCHKKKWTNFQFHFKKKQNMFLQYYSTCIFKIHYFKMLVIFIWRSRHGLNITFCLHDITQNLHIIYDFVWYAMFKM